LAQVVLLETQTISNLETTEKQVKLVLIFQLVEALVEQGALVTQEQLVLLDSMVVQAAAALAQVAKQAVLVFQV
jgi:hypothetical protein